MKNQINEALGDAGGHPHPQNVEHVSGKRSSTDVESFAQVNFNRFNRWAKLSCLFSLMLLLIACSTTVAPEPVAVVVEEEPVEAEVVTEENEEVHEEVVEEEHVEIAMVTVSHPSGELTVAQSPQTVVVFNYSALDTLDSLGIPVAGVPQGPLMPSHLAKYNGDEYVNVGSFFEPDFEAVNALNPDLIIIGDRSVSFYEDMLKIAPTLDVTGDWTNRVGALEAYVTNIGVIFDKETEATDALDAIHAHIAQVQLLAEESGYEALIVLTSGGEVSAYGPGSRFGFIHDTLGVEATDSNLTAESHGDTVSNEFILEQNPGVLFVLDRDAAIGAEDGEAAAVILDNELVNETSAAQNGRIVYLHPQNWYLADAGLTTFDAMISDVESAFETSAATETAANSGAFPLTLDHKYGSTTISDRPVRVVSVGFSEQDELLALGVKPVGLRAWYGDFPYEVWPWAQDELGDATPVTISTDGALNFEAIAEVNPDLIVGITSGMTEEEYNFLSEIAPTLPQSAEYADYGVPWQEVTRVLGQAVGEVELADDLVLGIEDRFAEVRANHPEWAGKTMAVAFWFNEVPGVYASEDPRPRLLSELGFVTPAEYDELAGESFYVSFSEEELSTLLDVDLIIWIAGDATAIQAIKDEPLRAALPAAQEGREIFLDPLLSGAFSFSSPLSLDYLLDEMVPMIEAAMDGDPTTLIPTAGE